MLAPHFSVQDIPPVEQEIQSLPSSDGDQLGRFDSSDLDNSNGESSSGTDDSDDSYWDLTTSNV